MSEKTKRAISKLTGLLAQPDNEDLTLSIIRASFVAEACCQRALGRPAPAAAIADLTERLSAFSRDKWGEIRDASEAMVRRVSNKKDTSARLDAMREIWGRLIRQVDSASRMSSTKLPSCASS